MHTGLCFTSLHTVLNKVCRCGRTEWAEAAALVCSKTGLLKFPVLGLSVICLQAQPEPAPCSEMPPETSWKGKVKPLRLGKRGQSTRLRVFEQSWVPGKLTQRHFLLSRMKKVLRSFHSQLPVLSDTEKDMKKELQTIHDQLQHLSNAIRQVRGGMTWEVTDSSSLCVDRQVLPTT